MHQCPRPSKQTPHIKEFDESARDRREEEEEKENRKRDLSSLLILPQIYDFRALATAEQTIKGRSREAENAKEDEAEEEQEKEEDEYRETDERDVATIASNRLSTGNKKVGSCWGSWGGFSLPDSLDPRTHSTCMPKGETAMAPTLAVVVYFSPHVCPDAINYLLRK